MSVPFSPRKTGPKCAQVSYIDPTMFVADVDAAPFCMMQYGVAARNIPVHIGSMRAHARRQVASEAAVASGVVHVGSSNVHTQDDSMRLL